MLFPKHKPSGDLLRVDDVATLVDPQASHVRAQDQAGQEQQDPIEFPKAELEFPSGEALPRCWIDARYQLR